MSADQKETLPPAPIERAVVIGDGSWGTSIAQLLARRGIATTLWSPFLEQTEAMRAAQENKKFLPGVRLHENVTFSADPL